MKRRKKQRGRILGEMERELIDVAVLTRERVFDGQIIVHARAYLAPGLH